jgi:hypothetical protein
MLPKRSNRFSLPVPGRGTFGADEERENSIFSGAAAGAGAGADSAADRDENAVTLQSANPIFSKLVPPDLIRLFLYARAAETSKFSGLIFWTRFKA